MCRVDCRTHRHGDIHAPVELPAPRQDIFAPAIITADIGIPIQTQWRVKDLQQSLRLFIHPIDLCLFRIHSPGNNILKRYDSEYHPQDADLVLLLFLVLIGFFRLSPCRRVSRWSRPRLCDSSGSCLRIRCQRQRIHPIKERLHFTLHFVRRKLCMGSRKIADQGKGVVSDLPQIVSILIIIRVIGLNAVNLFLQGKFKLRHLQVGCIDLLRLTQIACRQNGGLHLRKHRAAGRYRHHHNKQ